MCGRYSLYFDDEYDYDIEKMMNILKRDYPQTEIKRGEVFAEIAHIPVPIASVCVKYGFQSKCSPISVTAIFNNKTYQLI